MGKLKDNMVDYMVLRGYAPKTVKLYVCCVGRLAGYFGRSPLELGSTEIDEFLLSLRTRGRSDSTVRVYREAFKLFYAMNGRPTTVPPLSFARRRKRVPEVLGRSEIHAILEACEDLRLKAILSLLYSSGLRLSEALSLSTGDIDFERRTVFVRNGKNGKDRYTILSERAGDTLVDYMRLYRPTLLLFHNRQDPAKRVSPSAVQRRLKKLAEATGIRKRVHVHMLRHSFATHLLEDGTNLFHIMRLLGHAHVQTTMVYLHAQADDLSGIVSPLDTAVGPGASAARNGLIHGQAYAPGSGLPLWG